jgi:hypothetical protein
MGLKREVCGDSRMFSAYVRRLNGKSNIYTSLYSFERVGDYDSVVIDRAWWDFDMTEEYDMTTVKKDVAALINRLEGDVRLVATGRGFHVHLPFSRVVKGRRWAHNLDRYEREAAEGLSSLDGVGYPEKLTRVPDTYNTKRGKWAVVCDARKFAKDPLKYTIPKKPQKNMIRLDPFRGVVEIGECFDLVKWINDNPVKPKESEGIITVSVGLHDGECALPDCLNKAIRVSNPPHHVRVALVQEMRRQLAFYAKPKDMSEKEKVEIANTICSFISELGWLDYKEATTRKYVLGAVRKYEHAPSPRWYINHNLCDGKCWYCAAP